MVESLALSRQVLCHLPRVAPERGTNSVAICFGLALKRARSDLRSLTSKSVPGGTRNRLGMRREGKLPRAEVAQVQVTAWHRDGWQTRCGTDLTRWGAAVLLISYPPSAVFGAARLLGAEGR